MALILPPRRSLAYPGGSPGFNPLHLAAGKAMRFSGVATPSGFLSLYRGGSVSNTGTVTSSIDGRIGPVKTISAASSYMTFTQGAVNETVAACTFGMIYIPTASLAHAVVFNNNGGNGTGVFLEMSGLAIDIATNGTNISPAAWGSIFVIGTPYFIACSYNGLVGNFVLVNLLNGSIQTTSQSQSATFAASTASQYSIGGISAASLPMSGSLAAIMYSANSYLSLGALQEWATDPWGFWYPDTVRQTIFDSLKQSAIANTKTVTISSSSALAAVKQVAPIRGWTTTSALSVIKQAGKVLSWTTASAVSAIKSAGKVVAISSSSAVSALTTKAKILTVAISSSSAVSAIKSVGKVVAISSSSAVSAVGSFIAHISLHNQTISIATSGALSVIKAVSITLGSPVVRITDDGNIRITDDGNIRITDGVSSLTSASALSVIKSVGKVIAIATTSTGAVKIGRALSRVVTITTTSAVRMTKTIYKILADAISSAVSVATTAGITTAQAVTIATSSAVSVVKQVGKIIAIATTSVDAIAIMKTVAITKGGSVVMFVNSSSVSVIKAVSKTLGWRTVSSVVARAIKATMVTVTITCTSVVTIFPALIRYVLVIITTTSVVSLTEAFLAAGRATITLVGSATRVVLYGIKNVLSLIGQRPQLELTGMAREQDGTFHYGESWIINGIARDESGAVLDLTGATVQLRIVTVNPNAIVLDLATPTNGSITSPTLGLYSFSITPDQQIANAMTLNGYNYEARVTLSDGSIATLNIGEITVLPSKFVNFP